MRRRRLLGSVAAVLMTLTACGSTTTETAADAGAATALAGVVDTVAGGQIDLASLEGQDTVLWFWAPW
ncbi:MAG: hypothetical protein HKN94_11220 [Acidimicrobiales bacterium]|nr:hypothetical protein [Acidimicrobiales bacterium]RZV44745.1 MAG: hypothetical protein EX269_11215 [Acidimicrobiales bacterium]